MMVHQQSLSWSAVCLYAEMLQSWQHEKWEKMKLNGAMGVGGGSGVQTILEKDDIKTNKYS